MIDDAAAEFMREARKCPSCGALTRVVPHRALRWVCATCGAPRVPVAIPDAEAIERRALPAINGVRAARAAALGWRAGGGVLVGAAVLALGLAALLVAASATTAIVLAATGAAFLAFALLLAGRARKADRLAGQKLDEMWEAAAEGVLRAKKGAPVTAADLAATLRTDEAYAEQLLALLSVKSTATQELGDDAELRYRVPGAPDEAKVRAAASDDDELELADEEDGGAGARRRR